MKKTSLILFLSVLLFSCDNSDGTWTERFFVQNCTDEVIYLECITPENHLLTTTILPDSLGLPCGKYFDNKGKIFKALDGKYTPIVYMFYKSNWFCLTEKDSLSWLFPVNYDTEGDFEIDENGELYKVYIYELTDDYISTLKSIKR